LRDRLRHTSNAIDVESVQDVMQTHLPTLKSFAEHRIRGSGE
jgi:hypothetical protein